MRPLLLAFVLLIAGVQAADGGVAQSSARVCVGGDLAAAFSLEPGSMGAGNVVYRLRLTNVSSAACVLNTPLRFLLFDLHGVALPTHVTVTNAGKPAWGVIAAHRPVLYAKGRFSPDVPGVGEQERGPCEPVARRLRVTLPAGSHVTAAITPTTRVCERGSISLTVVPA